MDEFTKDEIDTDISRITRILASNILGPGNEGHLLRQSSFVDLFVCLRDLTAKAKIHSSRISFTDDVMVTRQVKDVTDLITFFRNALCYPDSSNNLLLQGRAKVTFSAMYGQGTAFSFGSTSLTSDYMDDTCFFIGEQKIYLKRHIIRAFEEAKQKLLPLL